MASAQASEKFSARNAVKMYDFDYAADAVDVAWVDMKDYGHFYARVFRSVGTGDVDTFKIIANSAADGSGTDYEIKAHALASAVDAVGDEVQLECSAEEIAAIGDAAGVLLRYVSVSLELATSTDECVVLYVRSQPRFAAGDLSADSIA